MKAMIYTAVGLIACASVFGLSDYLSAKKEGRLVNYTEQLNSPEVTKVKLLQNNIKVDVEKQVQTFDSKKSNSVYKSKSRLAQKNPVMKNSLVQLKEEIPNAPLELLPAVSLLEVLAPEKVAVENEKEILSTQVKPKRRPINFESFSRAAPTKGLKRIKN